MECDKPLYTGELKVDSSEELSRALEPFLGLSSVLLNTGCKEGKDWACTAGTSPVNQFGSVMRLRHVIGAFPLILLEWYFGKDWKILIISC